MDDRTDLGNRSCIWSRFGLGLLLCGARHGFPSPPRGGSRITDRFFGPCIPVFVRSHSHAVLGPLADQFVGTSGFGHGLGGTTTGKQGTGAIHHAADGVGAWAVRYGRPAPSRDRNHIDGDAST